MNSSHKLRLSDLIPFTGAIDYYKRTENCGERDIVCQIRRRASLLENWTYLCAIGAGVALGLGFKELVDYVLR